MKSEKVEQVTRDAVVWAYRLFLDREPENERVIDTMRAGCTDISELRREFLNSDEFRSKNPGLPTLSGEEPPMQIEVSVQNDDLHRLFNHVQETWERLGKEEPYWSVIPWGRFKLANMLDADKSFFYDTGQTWFSTILKALERNGIDYNSFNTCLEYGCGIARLLRWACTRFKRAYGYDVSKQHLRLAEAFLSRENIKNFGLCHLKTLEDIEDLQNVDFIYSIQVLQHNPPPLTGFIIRQVVKTLNTGGVAYFQVPTYRLGYKFSVQEYLNEVERPELEMHAFPQSNIFDIVNEEGAKVIEVLEDWKVGRYKEVSNAFLIQKE